MINSFSSDLGYYVGIFGACVYLISYTLMQMGFLKGQSYTYATLVIIAASCVLFSLGNAFNMSAFIIQTSYIVISIVGMTRLFVTTRLVRFDTREQAFLDSKMPLLRPHLARKLLKKANWVTLTPGDKLAEQGKVLEQLTYVHHGQADVSVDGHSVGACGPDTYVGELTFNTGVPATATVTAVEPMQCLVFAAQAVKPLIRANPEIAMALSASFSSDARDKLLRRNYESIAKAKAGLAD